MRQTDSPSMTPTADDGSDMPSTILDTDQLERFVTDGYVHLPEAFPRIVFDSISIYVERGAGDIARDFDVGALVRNRGQPLPRFAPGSGGAKVVFESPAFTFRLDQG